MSPRAGQRPALPAEGWHSRGYLPHFDQPGMIQMITFRLADSLPTEVLERLPDRTRDRDRLRAMETALDHGHGDCHLRHPSIAQLVEDALKHFDGERYRLLAWVVMPNHVHVLVEPLPGHTVSRIVQSWKSYTSKKVIRVLGLEGRFWQPEYFDRAIRDERHLANAVAYIHANPVRAGLAQSQEEWPFSSAARAGETPAPPGP